MRVIKSLNNNVALAVEGDGTEVVVFSKGVGFPKMPYELDETKTPIQRVFRDVDQSILALAGSINSDVLTASIAIADLAASELQTKLNQNLPFTIADHLQFAVKRLNDGVKVVNPLAEEVAYVYPRETELGRSGLKLFAAITGVELPRIEAASIALHLVNAECEGLGPLGDMAFVMQSTSVVDEAVSIIERDLGILVDRMSYSYARFVTHLRYLIRRLNEGVPSATGNADLFISAKRDFPDEHRCALDVAEVLGRACGCELNEEELLYLLLYINRLQSTR